MRWRRTILGMGLVCLVAGQAHAEYLYVFERSLYEVAPGGAVDVRVFVRETGTSLLATDGLVAAGMRLFFDEAPVPTQPARVVDLGDVRTNPLFDGPVLTDVQPGVSAGLEEAVDLLAPPVQAEGSGPPWQLLVGTFRFTAGLLVGEETHLRASDYDPTSSDTVTGNGQVLDALLQDARATIRVVVATAVPEPSGGILLGIGLAGSACAFRRRRSSAHDPGTAM